MRARYASTSPREVTRPSVCAACRSRIDCSSTSKSGATGAAGSAGLAPRWPARVWEVPNASRAAQARPPANRRANMARIVAARGAAERPPAPRTHLRLGWFPLANRAENMDSTALAPVGAEARGSRSRSLTMKRALFVLAGSSILAVASTVGVSTQTPAAAAANAPTFHKDVAPILNANCVSCHRPGEIGPMSFLSYETTRPWARSIKDKVVKREMPPWAADPHASMKFRNDRSLSQPQIDTIVAWANAGAPRGNPADAPPAADLRQRLAAGRARLRVRAADRVDGQARRAGAVSLLLREDPVHRGQVGGRRRDPAEQLLRRAPLGRLRHRHPRRPHGEGRLHVRPAGQADLALDADGQEGHLGRRHAAGRRRQAHLLRARPRLRTAPGGLRQAHPGR